jgi:hypothetical protein
MPAGMIYRGRSVMNNMSGYIRLVSAMKESKLGHGKTVTSRPALSK